MTTTATASELRRRPVPPLGGFRLTVLGLEVRRLLRNRRTLIFTMITPSIFFLLFGLNAAYASQSAGPGAHGNVSAFVLISMALYGAVLATTSGGAMISIERAQGWSRQLRLTPLTPVAYIATKMMTSLVLGFGSVTAVYIVGLLTHKPSMPAYLWIVTGLCVWIGSLLFAAFGLFLGYLLPTENVMQFMGFIMMLLSFGGGLFIPLSQYPHVLQDLAQYTPLYGLNELVHAPLLGVPVAWQWPVNVIVWLALFVAGAVWRFRKDTARA
ncbi:MAG TPA: ABC transporter permease [Streptosporangiaceae bacterium]|nr:ABC transporter permease [Streptosporangiaceae bacterium]